MKEYKSYLNSEKFILELLIISLYSEFLKVNDSDKYLLKTVVLFLVQHYQYIV